MECTELTQIELPATIDNIGVGAFCNCVKLERIKFPSDLKSVPSYLFQGCRALQFVYLPDSVDSIGDKAFCYCEKLERVATSKGLKNIRIGSDVFYGCGKLIR